jgi:penicillin amidase
MQHPKMKRFFALLLLILTILLIYLLDNGRHNVPGLGKLLSPTHGVWNNAVPANRPAAGSIKLSTPDGNAEIFFDERGVPHIFAPNEKSLYYAQGYVQASDRLWQMDFQVRIAAGRLSEAIGQDGLLYDRFFRRSGIPRSADSIVEALKDDPLYQDIVTSYTNGVNAYIKRLAPRDYPIEFKLAEYAPEPWTLRKSVLLLKLMAYRLSGFDTDVASSNTLAVMDRGTFDELFPVYPTEQSPVIPAGTSWNFDPTPVPVSEFRVENDSLIGGLTAVPRSPIPYRKGIGSNNWAVGRQKTASGGSILCNDPHLGLTFPSIWYEMQLSTPGLNVYGVTIPGAPCIIIGFNEDIAWGVTNASRDVQDWYSIRYKDDTQQEYAFEGEFLPVEERIEKIAVKRGRDFTDTVKWTAIGPVVYDASYGSVDTRKGLAARWLALDVSNELKTFYFLNKAKDHGMYMEALDHYANPAQNFVFADRLGNIAIRQQGKFRVKGKDEGRFVEPLEEQSLEQLNTFIPDRQNPHVFNPPRGFVSSANQHPTDPSYPYIYDGWFERYRNRRINELLDSMDRITAEDMKIMQNDAYSIMGETILPFLMDHIDESSLDNAGRAILDTLQHWDFINLHQLHAPSYFHEWFSAVKELLWDELSDTSDFYRIPLDYETFEFLVDRPDHVLIDNKNTPVQESVPMLIEQGFREMVDHFSGEDAANAMWRFYNSPSVEHLMGLPAFSVYDLPIGGSENCVNANNGGFGPSWRMIVDLNEEGVKAYGVYPGGQSGNPAHPGYAAFIDEWASGTYFELKFYNSRQEAEEDLETVNGIKKEGI